jgi:hypothetical protein
MARDETYQRAEKLIEETRQSGSREPHLVGAERRPDLTEPVLFHRIWSADIALREKLLKLAKNKNVFLADEFDTASQRIPFAMKRVASVVTVIPHKTRVNCISVSIEQAAYALGSHAVGAGWARAHPVSAVLSGGGR